jgi:transposase InsO family protein
VHSYDRSFEAPAPNRKWIADFTYVWTAEGWLYVAAVIDLPTVTLLSFSLQRRVEKGGLLAGAFRCGGRSSRRTPYHARPCVSARFSRFPPWTNSGGFGRTFH